MELIAETTMCEGVMGNGIEVQAYDATRLTGRRHLSKIDEHARPLNVHEIEVLLGKLSASNRMGSPLAGRDTRPGWKGAGPPS